MSNRNPFELRTDVLAMAKDYMDQAWHMNVEFTKAMFEAGKKSAEDVQEALKPYTIDSLMEKANEMYSFVSKKD